MTEEKKISVAEAEADLRLWNEEAETYGHDVEKMRALFEKMLVKYEDVIEGFTKGLRLVQPYEKLLQKTEDYRENVKLLLFRLQVFYDNGCTNEGLIEYYMALEHIEINREADFNDVRFTLGRMEGVSACEMNEIMEKLSEMEEIISKVEPKEKRWEELKPYLLWLTGKNANIALTILPLFFKIS